MTIARYPAEEPPRIARICDEMHRQVREMRLQQVNVVAGGTVAVLGVVCVAVATAVTATSSAAYLPLVGAAAAGTGGLLGLISLNNRTLGRMREGQTV